MYTGPEGFNSTKIRALQQSVADENATVQMRPLPIKDSIPHV